MNKKKEKLLKEAIEDGLRSESVECSFDDFEATEMPPGAAYPGDGVCYPGSFVVGESMLGCEKSDTSKE